MLLELWYKYQETGTDEFKKCLAQYVEEMTEASPDRLLEIIEDCEQFLTIKPCFDNNKEKFIALFYKIQSLRNVCRLVYESKIQLQDR